MLSYILGGVTLINFLFLVFIGGEKNGLLFMPHKIDGQLRWMIQEVSHRFHLIPQMVVEELHWWTRDFEIESVVIEYGIVAGRRVIAKLNFMNLLDGHIFNGRACVVEFATPQTIRQMEASYMNRITQPQPHRMQLQTWVGKNLAESLVNIFLSIYFSFSLQKWKV